MPPGSGAGSVASCSTSARTSERRDGESLIKAFHSRKPCTVSLEGNPSVALTSDADVRFFIRAFSQAKFTRATKKRQVLHQKYAKEDLCVFVLLCLLCVGFFVVVVFCVCLL